MGMGKKSSTTAEPKPVATDNNNNIPDDAQRRGLPIREASAANQSLLAPNEDRKKSGGMLS